MSGNGRHLWVSAERCIGCRACATVCPAGLITLTDKGLRRTVRFAVVCGEECDRCAAACPTEAIRLVSGAAPVGEGVALDFALEACEHCAAPMAPVQMLNHLRATIPEQVQTDAEGQAWLGQCPVCRREVEARRMAAEVLWTRWPG